MQASTALKLLPTLSVHGDSAASALAFIAVSASAVSTAVCNAYCDDTQFRCSEHRTETESKAVKADDISGSSYRRRRENTCNTCVHAGTLTKKERKQQINMEAR